MDPLDSLLRVVYTAWGDKIETWERLHALAYFKARSRLNRSYKAVHNYCLINRTDNESCRLGGEGWQASAKRWQEGKMDSLLGALGPQVGRRGEEREGCVQPAILC